MTQIYQDVLCGSMTPADAKKKLQSELLEGEVFVTPEIIEAMLSKYLAGEIDAELLSDWSLFLTTYDVYVTSGWEDDNQADKYEPMWEVLQQLSTPFIDGLITKERVRDHISELRLIST